jgi:hypothetical protein
MVLIKLSPHGLLIHFSETTILNLHVNDYQAADCVVMQSPSCNTVKPLQLNEVSNPEHKSIQGVAV